MLIQKIKTFIKNETKSLHFILSIYISLFALVAMVLIGMLLYKKFVVTLKENAMTSSVQVVEQVANTISSYVKDMIDISDSIVYNQVPDGES